MSLQVNNAYLDSPGMSGDGPASRKLTIPTPSPHPITTKASQNLYKFTYT